LFGWPNKGVIPRHILNAKVLDFLAVPSASASYTLTPISSAMSVARQTPLHF